MGNTIFSRQIDGKVTVPDGVKLADYILSENTILEMKTISKDVEESLKEKAHSLIGSNVIIYGDYQKSIAGLQDGDKINSKIYNHGTRLIENLLRKARDQIRSTKKYIGSDMHGGVVLILNDSLVSIPWEGILNKVSELLCRKDEEGNFKYLDIEKIILIQDGSEIDDGVYILNNSTTEANPDTENSVNRMLHEWSNEIRINRVRAID